MLESVKPYYQDELITIYRGDCRDILPTLSPVDLVLTDPPYGIGFPYESYIDTIENWYALMHFLIPWIHGNAMMGILPSCRISDLKWWYDNYPPDWLICWYKGSPGHRSYVGFNDWEPLLVYGKIEGLHMHDYFNVHPEPATNGHPCPKPLAWAKWLLSRTTPTSVIDPFMGSGTTLRACKDMGIRAIGVDIDEKYCEIAARRMAQDVLF